MQRVSSPSPENHSLPPTLDSLQRHLGHHFQRTSLLERALTHRSHSADHYERLEFLGDAVLNLAVSDLLLQRHTKWSEGELSRVRAHLVKQDTLAQLAMQCGLHHLLHLGEGELRSGGRQRPSIQADALEAILGAVYLDAGYEAATRVVQQLYRDVDSQQRHSSAAVPLGKDPKTALQEWLQGRKLPLPMYEVIQILGAAHRQEFEVSCSVAVSHQAPARGRGPSRRAAEQAAAKAMLAQLNAPSS
ncbi:MAG: ribonuclease [Pseudomonadota bacterium]